MKVATPSSRLVRRQSDLLPVESEHTEVQALLVELAQRMGHKVFVARNDRSREFQGRGLGNMEGVVDASGNTVQCRH